MSERTEAELKEQAYKDEKGPSHPDCNVILPDEDGAMQPTVISSFEDTVAVIAVPVNQRQMDSLRSVQRIAGMLGNIEEGIPGAPPLHALMSSAFDAKYEEMMIQLTTQLVDILTKTAGANHERNKD